jgi:putative DNA primase/helicase
VRYDAHAIHAALGADGWLNVLRAIGIDQSFLRDRHGPCPICGGRDRYRFDNRHGRGDYFCNNRDCGAGDGFKLVMGALGVDFREARSRIMESAGLSEESPRPAIAMRAPSPPPEPERADPTQRVRRLLRESCRIEDCEPVRLYLASRCLWPLPPEHSLRAHPSVEYWTKDNDGRPMMIGRYAALVAAVRDMCGELVTAHVTYIEPSGQKLQDHDPRKMLSPLTGREGCAIQLMPHASFLGVAEGIETALSASCMHNVPVWPTLNAGLLAKWEPPHTVDKVIIFADLDVAGLSAAAKLMERLQERVRLEMRAPTKAKDWNDSLRAA